ncbi:3444_t:CDS:2 [Acaulospora colombiana]|uniref:3444_t:CDS:1 n=1 Tax=Acaulospora colombiana TaxID=27376 RepID=A0ACA9KI19_9GLOM|nr:3444_t:CDS:2 [Acaulospora colombiana]
MIRKEIGVPNREVPVEEAEVGHHHLATNVTIPNVIPEAIQIIEVTAIDPPSHGVMETEMLANDEFTGGSVVNRGGSLNDSIHATKSDPYVNRDRVLSGGKSHQRMREEELAKRMDQIRIQNEKILEKRKLVEEDEKAFRKEEEELRKKDNEREENAKRKTQNRGAREWDKAKEETNWNSQQGRNYGHDGDTDRKSPRSEEGYYDRKGQENNENEDSGRKNYRGSSDDYGRRNSRSNDSGFRSPHGGSGEHGGGFGSRNNPRNNRTPARGKGSRGRGGGRRGGNQYDSGRRQSDDQSRDSYKSADGDGNDQTSDKPARDSVDVPEITDQTKSDQNGIL